MVALAGAVMVALAWIVAGPSATEELIFVAMAVITLVALYRRRRRGRR